jgi:uncharacterized protein
MSELEGIPDLPHDFSGVVRLFPLPNLVLFPGVMQPLHIFEPRYCEMLAEALEDDSLITMSLLKPGWQKHYDDRPALEDVLCIGRVVSQARDEQGRYNILLLGTRRAKLLRELPPTRPFRRAEVTLLSDIYPAAGASRRGQLQRRLIDGFRRFMPHTPSLQEHFDQLLSSQIPLGLLTDIMAFTLRLGMPFKQQMLAECNVDRRAERLLKQLQSLDLAGDAAPSEPVAEREFPPLFSDN